LKKGAQKKDNIKFSWKKEMLCISSRPRFSMKKIVKNTAKTNVTSVSKYVFVNFFFDLHEKLLSSRRKPPTP
jgi:hypothetical protein